jgi:NTE family protein
VPSRGLAAAVRLQRIFEAPDGVVDGRTVTLDGRVTQFEARSTQFWSLGERNRTFLAGGIGTSFDGTALPTNEYTVGGPLRLGAYAPGELRGQHYYSVTGGYLRQVGRLPDFVGGAVFAGAWADQSDAFDDWGEAAYRVNPGLGVVMDTLLGPVMLAGSAGFDGRWRVYVGVGRIFR